MNDFKSQIARAGITKAELSRRLGLTTRAVSSWKNCPPTYATAYLELLIAYNRIAP